MGRVLALLYCCAIAMYTFYIDRLSVAAADHFSVISAGVWD